MSFSRLGASDEPLFRFSTLSQKGRRRSTYEAERGGFVTHPPSRIPPATNGLGPKDANGGTRERGMQIPFSLVPLGLSANPTPNWQGRREGAARWS